MARSRAVPAEGAREAPPVSATNVRARPMPRRLAYFAIALYCLLAWVVAFEMVGAGINMVTSPKSVHYAERGTDE